MPTDLLEKSILGGVPGGTRTPDLLLRRQLLYPVELRALEGKAGNKWSGRWDSNSRPSAPKADALPDCATPRHEERILSPPGNPRQIKSLSF